MAKRSRTKRRAANPSRVVGRPERPASIGSVYGVQPAQLHLNYLPERATRLRLQSPAPVASQGPSSSAGLRERRVNMPAVMLHSPKVSLFEDRKSGDLSVCQARQTRKEVLHATGKTGGGPRKPANFTSNSRERC